MIVWIIGKSGSGKTFFAEKILKKIKTRKKILIDGDEIRRYIFNNKLGFTLSDRRKNAEYISNLCYFLELKGFLVICSIQSIFRDLQKKNHLIFKKYVQVYLRVNQNILEKRNNKGIYKNIKNVIGKDIKFPTPYKSHLVIKNNFNNNKFSKELNKVLKLIYK